MKTKLITCKKTESALPCFWCGTCSHLIEFNLIEMIQSFPHLLFTFLLLLLLFLLASMKEPAGSSEEIYAIHRLFNQNSCGLKKKKRLESCYSESQFLLWTKKTFEHGQEFRKVALTDLQCFVNHCGRWAFPSFQWLTQDLKGSNRDGFKWFLYKCQIV